MNRAVSKSNGNLYSMGKDRKEERGAREGERGEKGERREVGGPIKPCQFNLFVAQIPKATCNSAK